METGIQRCRNTQPLLRCGIAPSYDELDDVDVELDQQVADLAEAILAPWQSETELIVE